MKLGMNVGLGPGHIVLDGDLAPLPKGTQHQFLVHVCCGQTAGLIKMPLGTEVDLGPSDRHCVRWGSRSPPQGGTAPPILAHVLRLRAAWIKVPIDTGVCLGPGHIVLHEDRSSPLKSGTPAPSFQPMSDTAP